MLETPYDILVIIWGLIFVVAWIVFIVAMNHLFQSEERFWEQRDAASDPAASLGQHHPLHPAA